MNINVSAPYTQVDTSWAQGILDDHQPGPLPSHCDQCGVRWPCPTADMAATLLALYEAAESPPSLTG